MELYRLDLVLKGIALRKKSDVLENVKDSWSVLFVNFWDCKENQAKVSCLNCSKQ